MTRRSPVPVARGDRLTLAIDALGDGPDGIGHVGDYVVFVPGVLPGEQAEVRITSAGRKFARAELLAVRRAAPERVPARCPHFLACGGCDRQHQDYGAQLRDKQARLQRTLAHALGAAAPVVPAPLAGEPFGQRHKVVLHLQNGADGGLEAGFRRRRSPELVAVHECPASAPRAWALAHAAVQALAALRHPAWDPDFAPRGLLRSVLVRATTTGEAHLLVVARQAHVPGLERAFARLHAAGATTIGVNGNPGELSQLLGPETRVLSGPPRIAERLLGTTYLLSPDAFFQTSPFAAAQLVQQVVDWLAPSPRDDVGDLYCGGGLLTLPLARAARSAFGIELGRRAIHDAEAAARANGIANVTFRTGHVESWLAACRRGELPRPHLVALDPPRAGLGPAVVDELRRLAPRRLAYVSCDLGALARDLQALQAAGFVTRQVRPVEMFPQTAHVEAVAGLERVA
ncbi:MAG: 23S rRNA (uracil(1939)-C(5))-methyltransferase RlmD [Planctomycetes bacterium]|nr:23S rRNA (uracil(1939)-C(5))-methyltransferase RlmD [Planctomycetota bacterium]